MTESLAEIHEREMAEVQQGEIDEIATLKAELQSRVEDYGRTLQERDDARRSGLAARSGKARRVPTRRRARSPPSGDRPARHKGHHVLPQ